MHSSHSRLLISIALVGALIACSASGIDGDESFDAGRPRDASTAADTGGNNPDAGSLPSKDSGNDTSAPLDAGADAKTTDSSAPDTGPPDSGPPDAGTGILTNTPATTCAQWSGLGPAAGEDGHYAAVRLTPPQAPWLVKSISYDLLDQTGTNCSVNFAHRVEIYKGSSTTPPATPVVLAFFDVPAGATNLVGTLQGLDVTQSVRRVKLNLSSPLTLQPGEHLFVAVKMHINATPKSTCVLWCNSTTGTANRNWWSAAAATPYPWATLASYGLNQDLRIWAE